MEAISYGSRELSRLKEEREMGGNVDQAKPLDENADQSLLAHDYICQKMNQPNLLTVLEIFAYKILNCLIFPSTEFGDQDQFLLK